MTVLLTVNGTGYDYPETGDVSWGPDATDWAVAVTSGMLQKQGGLFLLLSEVDFGASFGLKSIYYKSRATNPSSAGILRLGVSESVGWRNNANAADLLLGVNGSDQLTFAGSTLSGTFISALTGDVTATGPGSVVATLASVGTAGTYVRVTTDAKGRVTSGDAAPLALAYGGTNANLTAANGAIPYSTGSALALLAPGSSGQVLTSGGAGAPTWTTALTNPMNAPGQMIYGAAAGTPTVVAAGTSGQFLKSNGTSAPTFSSFTAPTVQKFTTGSGTYNRPANVLYIKVKAVGGGGGGGGSGTGTATGGTGGTTTFGAVISLTGGTGGQLFNAVGAGGTATVTGPVGTILDGATGSGASANPNSTPFPYAAGGVGGTSPLGGAGGGGSPDVAGNAAKANTGSGGGGGGGANTTNASGGCGGGAGAFCDVIITSPSATYSYAVGAAGAGASAGVGGRAGGAGAIGYIEVIEYYQ